MSEKTRAELKEQIKIMNHNYQVIREMHERGYQYSVGEIKRLQDELERTRKALEIAKDTIRHADWFLDGDYNVDAKTMHNEIKCAIKGITTLEQKEYNDDEFTKVSLQRLCTQ